MLHAYGILVLVAWQQRPLQGRGGGGIELFLDFTSSWYSICMDLDVKSLDNI